MRIQTLVRSAAVDALKRPLKLLLLFSFSASLSLHARPSLASGDILYFNDFAVDGSPGPEFTPINDTNLFQEGGLLNIENPNPGNGMKIGFGLALPADINCVIYDGFFSTLDSQLGDSIEVDFSGDVLVDGLFENYTSGFTFTQIKESLRVRSDSITINGVTKAPEGGIDFIIPGPGNIFDKLGSLRFDVVGDIIFIEVNGVVSDFIDPPEIEFQNIRSMSLSSNNLDVIQVGSIIGTNIHPQVPGPLPIFGTAAAFGFSRKLRKRIKGAPAVASSIG